MTLAHTFALIFLSPDFDPLSSIFREVGTVKVVLFYFLFGFDWHILAFVILVFYDFLRFFAHVENIFLLR